MAENTGSVVAIPLERYNDLIQLETRVDVAVERIFLDKSIKTEDLLSPDYGKGDSSAEPQNDGRHKAWRDVTDVPYEIPIKISESSHCKSVQIQIPPPLRGPPPFDKGGLFNPPGSNDPRRTGGIPPYSDPSGR